MLGNWNSKNLGIILGYAVTSLIFFFIIFSHLGTLSLRLWDEARNAVNAIDMLESGFSIITKYKGNPELWNTKPPLLIWLQAFFMKIIGINVISMRLPSALAAISIIPILSYFFRRLGFSHRITWLSLLILITIPLSIMVHCFKTGDYDALLCLFILSYTCFFYLFLAQGKVKDLLWFSIFFSLAGLTKGIAGFLMLPSLFILSIWKDQVISLLKQKSFYLSMGFIIAVLGGYYLLREYSAPGYLSKIWENELGGRFGPSDNIHIFPFHYYFHFLWTSGLGYIKYLLLFIPFGFISNESKDLAVFSLVASLGHLFVISASQTKLYWYCLPAVPFIAISIASGIYALGKLLKEKPPLKVIYELVVLALLGYLIFSQIQSVTRVSNFSYEAEQFSIPEYIDENLGNPELIDGFLILHKHSSDHSYFYVKKAERLGIHLQIANYKRLEAGDKVLVAHNGVEQDLFKQYDLEHLGSFGNGEGQKYRILGFKVED